jgi:hypothetical protein
MSFEFKTIESPYGSKRRKFMGLLIRFKTTAKCYNLIAHPLPTGSLLTTSELEHTLGLITSR